MKDKDLFMLVISGLPEEYHGLKTIALSRQLAFNELHAFCADHEFMLKKTTISIPPAQAFSTSTKPSSTTSPVSHNNAIQAVQQLAAQLGLQLQFPNQPQAHYTNCQNNRDRRPNNNRQGNSLGDETTTIATVTLEVIVISLVGQLTRILFMELVTGVASGILHLNVQIGTLLLSGLVSNHRLTMQILGHVVLQLGFQTLGPVIMLHQISPVLTTLKPTMVVTTFMLATVFEGPKPSKTYIKYKTRQKRADAKKALNDLLFRSARSKFTLEGEFWKKHGTPSWDGDPFDPTDNKKKREPLKSAARNASKAHQKRNRSKSKKGNFFEDFDDDDPGIHFQATYGNRWYSWSFKSWEEAFSQRQTGFEWREYSYGNNNRNKWRTLSDDEATDDDESCVGSHADRITLGLPINGPLKIDEVKNAFRLSALKWHPDKHQGPSQALAEEKFKVCVTAYKSLCNALSTV